MTDRTPTDPRVWRRICELDVGPPHAFLETTKPALDDRTIDEVLAEPDGLRTVLRYLDKVANLAGERPPPTLTSGTSGSGASQR